MYSRLKTDKSHVLKQIVGEIRSPKPKKIQTGSFPNIPLVYTYKSLIRRCQQIAS